MPDSTTINRWTQYLKIHQEEYPRIDPYFKKNLDDAVKLEVLRQRRINEIYDAIAVFCNQRQNGVNFEEILSLPEYKAIIYNEISDCVYSWDGRLYNRNPITEQEHVVYPEEVDAILNGGQLFWGYFGEDRFREYAITKTITWGQSLAGKEKILERHISRETRLGRKPSMAKYNLVKNSRKVATKQGGSVLKILSFLNSPFLNIPFSAWTNVFSTGGVYLPDEDVFRNRVKHYISLYLTKQLPEPPKDW